MLSNMGLCFNFCLQSTTYLIMFAYSNFRITNRKVNRCNTFSPIVGTKWLGQHFLAPDIVKNVGVGMNFGPSVGGTFGPLVGPTFQGSYSLIKNVVGILALVLLTLLAHSYDQQFQAPKTVGAQKCRSNNWAKSCTSRRANSSSNTDNSKVSEPKIVGPNTFGQQKRKGLLIIDECPY